MKNLEWRVATLGAVGVTVAGTAQAGWWVLLAWTSPDGGVLWPAVAFQLLLTLTFAAAVAWQSRRELRAIQPSLRVLAEQVQALEQGRAAPVADLPWADVAALGHRLQRLSQRLGSPEAGSEPADPHARRPDRLDPLTGLHTRFAFLQRLSERLASRDRPETALVLLRVADAQGAPAARHAVHAVLNDDVDAFAGQLSDRELALCLPQHRVADAVGAQLRSADPSAAGWQVHALDHLGGQSPTAVMSALDAAWSMPDTAAAVPSPEAVAAALQAGRVRLGAFPVQNAAGDVLHLECPLRLQLVDGGPWEPAERWLGVAVRARLAPQVDLQAIDLALRTIASDPADRCVHVSSESLGAAGFVDAVRQRLQASPDAARHLWIEVAEVSFERLPAHLRQAVTVWRRCGVRVGVEHAGSGLRSWVRLDDLALDYVKIDARFVRGLAVDAEQRDWVRALAACARECGAQVLAEGADDPADLHALWPLGFDGATGRAVGSGHTVEGESAQAMSPV